MTAKKTQWKETGFKLSNGIEFNIYHNLPETHGLSISDAFENWLARAMRYSAKDFVIYIRSKLTDYQAYTEEEWKKLNSK